MWSDSLIFKWCCITQFLWQHAFHSARGCNQTKSDVVAISTGRHKSHCWSLNCVCVQCPDSGSQLGSSNFSTEDPSSHNNFAERFSSLVGSVSWQHDVVWTTKQQNRNWHWMCYINKCLWQYMKIFHHKYYRTRLHLFCLIASFCDRLPQRDICLHLFCFNSSAAGPQFFVSPPNNNWSVHCFHSRLDGKTGIFASTSDLVWMFVCSEQVQTILLSNGITPTISSLGCPFLTHYLLKEAVTPKTSQ